MFRFNPFTTRHDADNAYALAMAADLAYVTRQDVKATLTKWKLSKHKVIDTSTRAGDTADTQVFIAANRDIIIVAFRGTEKNARDYVTDARFGLVDGPLEGRVHRGFNQALEEVWPDVMHWVSKYGDNHQAIWATGHSLGAALATLAAARWAEQDRPFYGLYTFGSPRVGDRRFARHFNAEAKHKTFRYVNNRDIVTRVPPRGLDYRHVGTLKYFDSDGRLHDNPGLWNQFLDTVAVGVEGLSGLLLDSFGDHLMSKYTKLTKRVRKNPDLAEPPSRVVLDIRSLLLGGGGP